MTIDTDPALEVALSLTDQTDRLALDGFGARRGFDRKADGTPVTDTDVAIERHLRAGLLAAFPDHAVLGEEDGGRLDPAQPTWVIDPIDATGNYIRGIEIFATLVALVVDDTAVLSVVSAPAQHTRWWASPNTGAVRDGRPINVSSVDRLDQAQLIVGGLEHHRHDPHDWGRIGHLVAACRRTRGFGDYWGHLLVAGGNADIMVDRDLRIWDTAALIPLIVHAGGTITTWTGGNPLDGGDILTTNGPLHRATLEHLKPTTS